MVGRCFFPSSVEVPPFQFIDSVEDTPVWHQSQFTPRISSEPPTEVSAVPAEVVDAKTGVEEPLVVHGLNLPASGPQNNVHFLPKKLDEKVVKMHLSALHAELIVMSGEIGSTGTIPKADFGASCERPTGPSTSTGSSM